MSDENSYSFLLVDDDEIFRERLARALRTRGHEVRTAADFDSAVAAAREDSPERALVDLRMPGKSGLDVVRELHAIDAGTQIVVLTGYGSIATAVDAVQLGAVNYLSKPADLADILAAFSRDNSAARELPAVEQNAPSLARAEWEYINRVLSECNGNISEAARRLDMHRRSLQRKLQKHPPRE